MGRDWKEREDAEAPPGDFVAVAVRAVEDALAPVLAESGEGGKVVEDAGRQDQAEARVGRAVLQGD